MKIQKILFEYPFLFKSSTYEDLSEQLMIDLIDKYSILSASQKKIYKKARLGSLTAQVYPNAGIDKLIVLGRWMFFGFCFDDFYGSRPINELKIACQRAIDILKGELPEEGEPEFFHQLTIIKKEFSPFVTDYWFERLIRHHQDWFEGMEIETEYNNEKTQSFPSVEDYMLIREKLVGGELVCDQLEVVSDFIMTEEIFTHPDIKRYRQLFFRLMAWFNDLYSFEKEALNGEKMNLVLVIENERNCSRSEAYIEAVHFHNDDLEEFIRIGKNIPDFGIQNEGLKRYVHNAELFLKGQEAWYKNGTKRYIITEE
ncbi:hypothetical protein QWZ06_25885 [Chryseobacterium tructae]|uniref:Terpene synthase n=1 Tax=Chryseobacterium tructae TaxID=1037380 RepID=A0ABV7XSP3_9FLAO|nr:hypothetical protein [Chryseobacterium tructae]MDN3695411.1 hypothetical protein [Chryseobacterium tructae]